MGEYKQSGHVPGHAMIPGAIYMVTAGTHQKRQIFNTPEKLELLQAVIQERCRNSGWELQAWVILNNHYHFIAQAPPDEANIAGLMKSIHSKSAVLVNRMDGITGRRIWYNYWNTCIRTEDEYWDCIRYVLVNPERHGIVEDYRTYPFSSYSVSGDKPIEPFEQEVSSGLLEFFDDY